MIASIWLILKAKKPTYGTMVLTTVRILEPVTIWELCDWSGPWPLQTLVSVKWNLAQQQNTMKFKFFWWNALRWRDYLTTRNRFWKSPAPQGATVAMPTSSRGLCSTISRPRTRGWKSNPRRQTFSEKGLIIVMSVLLLQGGAVIHWSTNLGFRGRSADHRTNM